ncbi:MAG TPA: hypothetical protein VJ841_04930 [Candidatus Saccharimonadales bacterium]|nr:hypothetical protein [Candidatus Saccharimonadales bacterium]
MDDRQAVLVEPLDELLVDEDFPGACIGDDEVTLATRSHEIRYGENAQKCLEYVLQRFHDDDNGSLVDFNSATAKFYHITHSRSPMVSITSRNMSYYVEEVKE